VAVTRRRTTTTPRGDRVAAAEAIERKLLTDPPGECMTWLEGNELLARAALEAAEEVWPHQPPKRDPASTSMTTDRAWTRPRQAPATSHGYGFGLVIE
jgi:hypothetical protein